MSRILLILALILSTTACATISTLKPGQGSTFEVRNTTYDALWKASIEVVSRSLTIVEFNKKQGYIKAEAPAKMASWGEVAGVFISPSEPSADIYTVEVVSMKRMRTQLTGQNWEPTLIAGIKSEITQ